MFIQPIIQIQYVIITIIDKEWVSLLRAEALLKSPWMSGIAIMITYTFGINAILHKNKSFNLNYTNIYLDSKLAYTY